MDTGMDKQTIRFGACLRLGSTLFGLTLLWLVAGSGVALAQGVEFGLAGLPDDRSMVLGERVVLTVEGRAGEQEVDSAAVYLTFDPRVLQVNAGSVTVADSLDIALVEIGKTYFVLDNEAGFIRYQAGRLGGSATGTFPFFSLEFTAVGVGESLLSFADDPENHIDNVALRAGIDLLGRTDSAQIDVVRGTGSNGPDDGPNNVYLPMITRASQAPLLSTASAADQVEGAELAASPTMPATSPSVAESDSDAGESQDTGELQRVFLPTILEE